MGCKIHKGDLARPAPPKGKLAAAEAALRWKPQTRSGATVLVDKRTDPIADLTVLISGGPGSLESGVMSALDRDEVARVAALARVDLTETELDRFAGELAVVVDAVATVSEHVGPDIPATSHPLVVHNVFRTDMVGDLLDRDELLASAPEAEDGMFVVARILGEE